MKKIKIAVLGYGNRGCIYAENALHFPDEYEVTAIAETDPSRRKKAAALFSCPIYQDGSAFLQARVEADIVAVATQDHQHREHAIACMEAGYDLLLEKPISNTPEGCVAIFDCAKRLGRKVIVCHVLRYTPFYRKIKELVDSGAVGDVVTIHASENVGFYHQAHSFVRGPWRNSIQ